MIQRLRNKFIAISTAALVIVLITIIGSMVSVSSIHAHREANDILTLLSQHNGQLSTKNANEAVKSCFNTVILAPISARTARASRLTTLIS